MTPTDDAAPPQLVDSHCHLDFPDFDGQQAELVARARAAGVTRMVTICTRLRLEPSVRAIAGGHDGVFYAAGTHPMYAAEEPLAAVEDLVALVEQQHAAPGPGQQAAVLRARQAQAGFQFLEDVEQRRWHRHARQHREAQAMRLAGAAAAAAGAEVTIFGGDYLGALPHYRGQGYGIEDGAELVEAVRKADGILVSAPGYHGSISGLVKNALDYLEDLAKDERPYLDGRAVGLIATAYGDQATMSTLLTLRSIVHALRGWPTPFAAAINSAVTAPPAATVNIVCSAALRRESG